MTNIVLPPVTNGNNISTLNDNFRKVQESVNNDLLNLDGGNNVMQQDLDMNGNDLLNVATDVNNPGSMLTVGAADSRYYNVSGDTLAGPMSVNGQVISGLAAAVAATSPVRKQEFDAAVFNTAFGLEQRLASAAEGDGLIGVKQPYTGSILRTQHDVNAETLYVTDFAGVDRFGVIDSTDGIQAALDAAAGKRLVWPNGTYIKSRNNRIHANTHLVFEPGAVVRRVGNLDSWMFVNGEVGNATYATGYLGDGNIRISGGTFDLGGIPGVRTSAAFVMGHSRNLVWEYCVFKNGWESHNIEINASTDALFFKCTFQDQGFAGAGSYEAINIDSANAAGFPGFGVYDLTLDVNIIVAFCTFRNVYGGVSSHGIAAGAGHHSRLKIIDSYFENIAKKAVRCQGWDDSFVCRNHFINIGEEAISFLIGDRNIARENNISGASTSVNGQFSAIRIDGNDNIAKENIIRDGGYVNKFPYSYGIAAGSRNEVGTKGASVGTSGLVSDSGTLTSIDGRTLLFSGNATGVGTVINLLDSMNNYDHLEISNGAVGSGLYQTSIVRPFARRNWAVGTDRVAATTASGRFVAVATTLTSLTTAINADALRHVYGVSQ